MIFTEPQTGEVLSSAIYPHYKVNNILLIIKYTMYTVEPPLSTTYLRAPIHTLIETSLQRPPLNNGQIFLHQGGCCEEVQLYYRLFHVVVTWM